MAARLDSAPRSIPFPKIMRATRSRTRKQSLRLKSARQPATNQQAGSLQRATPESSRRAPPAAQLQTQPTGTKTNIQPSARQNAPAPAPPAAEIPATRPHLRANPKAK